MATEQANNSAIYIGRDQMTSMLSDSELTSSQQQKVDNMVDERNDALAENGLSGNLIGGSDLYPLVLPSNPTFSVPNNPLLPPEYSELLDYNSIQYMNGILRTQIGRYVRIRYSMGTNGIEEYDGFLIGVGINYIVLQYYLNNNIQIIDFYGIKSVVVFYEEIVRPPYAAGTAEGAASSARTMDTAVSSPSQTSSSAGGAGSQSRMSRRSDSVYDDNVNETRQTNRAADDTMQRRASSPEVNREMEWQMPSEESYDTGRRAGQSQREQSQEYRWSLD